MFLGAGARSKTSVRQRLTLKLAAALVNTTPSDGSVSASKLAASALGSGVSMINGVIANSAAGNALTVSLKTLAGTDPTASDPIYIVFRDAALGGGNYSVLTITSAISLTISSGSTLGALNSTPFRLWLVCFNDGGTPRLALINCLNPNPWNIFPLGQIPVASSTAEGGAGAADSVWVFYSGVAVTSKAYSILGYFGFESGLATAGTWNTTAGRLELFRPWTPLPGALISQVETRTGAAATGTTTIPADNTTPQNTEGDQYIGQQITPTSAANVLIVTVAAQLVNSGSSRLIMALFQDSNANALATAQVANTVTSSSRASFDYVGIAGATGATTFKFRAGSPAAGTTTFNGDVTNVSIFNGTLASFMRIQEFQA